MKTALISGAGGALAQALAHTLAADYQVFGLSRSDQLPPDSPFERIWTTDYSEASLAEIASQIKEQVDHLDLLLVCNGVLHGECGTPSGTISLWPEKRLADLNEEQLQAIFYINSIVPSLVIKHFSILWQRRRPAKAIVLSAMVGSISDNHLGGWYGYRASKAALNMLIKTMSVEFSRSYKRLAVAAVHPGTTESPLSQPFSERVPQGKLYSPAQSAERISKVIANLTPDQTGGFFHWDGSPLPW